ncbi:MAG: YraN family protein [Planctomycetes bacterium]|nr:YraN family protein [Planctomycetota bacterium]
MTSFFGKLFRRGHEEALTTGDTGRLSQRAAERHLKAQGYKILRSNLRDREGELDLIARDPKTACIVVAEVRSFKARPNWTYADALPDSKKKQVCESALRLLPRAKLWQAGQPLRFDAIMVHVDDQGAVLEVKHFQNDFVPERPERY